MKTIKERSELDGRVYVLLEDGQTGAAFLQQAEREGFRFCDGAKPTVRPYARIMAVNRDGTINYVGVNGYMAFGANAPVGGKRLIRVDYRRA